MTGKRRAGRDPVRPPAPPPTPTPSPARPVQAGPFVVTRPPSRREARAQRRRQRRRRVGAVGVIAIVLAAIIVAIGVGYGVHKATSGSGAPKRTQTTLLMSLVGGDKSAVGSVLLAHDTKTDHGVEVLLPSRVVAETCGFGSQQLGKIMQLPGGERLSRDAVSSLLGGITVDGSWTVTTGELATLIDRVGGVTVDVDTDVIVTSGGRRVLLLPKGNAEHLAGARAINYATYVAPGEDPTGSLPRLQAVVEAFAAALPKDQARVTQLLAAGGPHTASTLGAGRLAKLLLGFAADDQANTVLPSVLPVVKIDTGGQVAFRVDSDATNRLVTTNLGASLPSTARGPRARVLIQNGVGTPGLVGSACRRLVAAGYVIVGSGNASSFNFTQSRVLVFDSSVASARLGDAVAQSLKISTDDVEVSTEGQNVADVIVILGKDYRP